MRQSLNMKLRTVKFILPTVAFALPGLAYAAQTFGGIIITLQDWVKALVPLAIGVAVIVFIWGMIVFIGNSGSEEKRAEGRQRMIWGVIALFAIVSVWGLVGFVRESILGPGSENPNVPKSPGLPKAS